VIGAILFLRNPLNLRKLACLLEISLDDLMLVLERLHSILSIPENHNDTGPVTAFHSSLYECLTSKDRAGVFFIDPSLKHAALAKNCLNHIKNISSNDFKFKFIFRYPSNYRRIIEQRFRLRSDTEQAVIRYSCRYWSFHLSKTYRRGTPNDFAAPMRQFVFYDLIAWSTLLLLDAQPNMETAREREWEQMRENEQERVALTERRYSALIGWFLLVAISVLLFMCGIWLVTAKFKFNNNSAIAILSLYLCLFLVLGGAMVVISLYVMSWAILELKRAHQDVKICMSQASPWIRIDLLPHRICQNIALYQALRSARGFRRQQPVEAERALLMT